MGVISYRRDGGRQVNALGECHVARLERARKIDIAELFTQICSGRQQLNKAVLDNQFDVGAFRDSSLDLARGCDEEGFAAMKSIRQQS
jgi:hypothetical protein